MAFISSAEAKFSTLPMRPKSASVRPNCCMGPVISALVSINTLPLYCISCPIFSSRVICAKSF